MYKLTNKRLMVAKDILEAYRSQLAQSLQFDAPALEHELKKIWSIGYQEIIDIMIEILKNHDRYRYVAAYYMENSDAPGVAFEFKAPLSKAYGISRYDSDARNEAQLSFWESAQQELSYGKA
ncbi:MAG: hypothetical protein PF961_13125 [Planctomycetota bacterium]|nr:hypothetical protein [Planctomycetota bacterium]